MKTRARRALVLALAGLTAAGIATGVALARSTPSKIGVGAVVIETNLGYQGGAAAGSGIVLTSNGTVLIERSLV